MRACPHCKINVMGKGKTCPLCQSPLQGEETNFYFPEPKALEQGSIAWKIIWFLFVATSLVCLGIDFLIGGFSHYHWSFVVIIWTFSLIWFIGQIIKHHNNVPKIFFFVLLYYGILVGLTGKYIGVFSISVNYIIPIMCCVTLSANFIISFIDRRFMDNSLVYILLNIVVGIAPYIVLLYHRGAAPILWIISLMISIVTFAGFLIFRGKSVWVEIQKRMHI